MSQQGFDSSVYLVPMAIGMILSAIYFFFVVGIGPAIIYGIIFFFMLAIFNRVDREAKKQNRWWRRRRRR